MHFDPDNELGSLEGNTVHLDTRLRQLADSKTAIEDLWIGLSQICGAAEDARRASSTLLAWASILRSEAESKDMLGKYAALHRLLIAHIHYAPRQACGRACFIHHAIAHGEGNCLTLALMCLILSRRIGLPLRIHLFPGHIYPVIESSGHMLTSDFASQLDLRPLSIIEKRFRRSDPAISRCPGYCRPLTDQELFGCILTAWTAVLTAEHRTRSAYAVARYAIQLFPDNPDAHFNLGMLAQHIGFPHVARGAFVHAHSLYPAMLLRLLHQPIR